MQAVTAPSDGYTRANTSLGGYEDEFVDAVDEYWHCAICQLPLKEPILTRCGHRFCKECINAHFERLERDGQCLQCPVDRNQLSRSNADIFPDRATERKILSFAIKCPSNGCLWSGELRSKDIHLDSCPFKVVSCTNENCELRLVRKDLQNHVEFKCDWRILHCIHCNLSHAACKTEAHQSECSRFPINCPENCGAVIPREEVSAHLDEDCPLFIVSCPYVQMGCTEKIQRREVESHLESATKLHLDFTCLKLSNTEVMINKTREELEETREELKETRDELKGTREELAETLLELEETKRKLDENINAVESRLEAFAEAHTWKISRINEVLKEAESGNKSVLISPSFYDHKYKFRLTLNVKGEGSGENTHLSIFFVLMKGEYDAMLSWPYIKKVTFTLIDQQEDLDQRENIVVSFTVKPNGDLNSFKRPMEDENVGWGFSKFVLRDNVKERRYVVDDTMFIQVQVDEPSD